MSRKTETQFNLMVASLKKDPEALLFEMTPLKLDLTHMALGIAGEAGELVDAVKKFAIYDKPLDLINVVEELGDLEFYMQGIRAALGITREETLEATLAKLGKRYPAGYSNAAAARRADKEGDGQ